VSRGRILLVDDEMDLASAFAEYLVDHGFDAVAVDGACAFDVVRSIAAPDCVVLDLAMPGEDGHSILRRFRADSDVPVIVMSATAGLLDRVLSLEMGADDVVAKPIEPRELMARIEGLLARRRSNLGALVRLDRVTVDLRAARVMRDDGTEERLGPGEVMLLKAFLGHPGKMLTREDLLDLAPAVDRDALERSIDARISRLKRKLETDWIETRRGVGYVFALPRGQDG
jgi:DNA-binding response OmpR family regulator